MTTSTPAKPTGAICNLDCKYCFFLSKQELYANSRFRMNDDVLERFIRQQLESQGPQATIAPKNRFILTADGEPGLNYLCAGYKAIFNHIDRPMRMMADLLRQGRFADEVMQLLTTETQLQPLPSAPTKTSTVPAAAA